MAIVVNNSSVINDILAGNKANGSLERGKTFTAKGQLAVGATDSATSQYRLCVLPSNVYLNLIFIYNTALTGGTSYSVGIVGSDIDGEGYINLPNLFSASLDLSTQQEREIRFRALLANSFEAPLWEILGLSEDYGGYYYLVITANTPGTVAGNIGAMVQYSAT